jgi:hypothetical protein
VAIVDTGIGPHPDLNIAGSYNCSTSDHSAWRDKESHGTHVAGTVGAINNDFGVVGVAPGARVWGVKILNDDGYGLLSWYVCGLDWILAQRDPNDSSRPLFEAVGISMSIPGLVPPVGRDGRLLVDGGVLNNLPVDTMHELAEGPIVAVDVARRHERKDGEDPRIPSIMETMARSTIVRSTRSATSSEWRIASAAAACASALTENGWRTASIAARNLADPSA